ncbi:probable E3 ubiquitin-protein ligase TRIML1 [Dromiciops gliroides]|uniref:probable E3 ubiquitin-protein ligase TRIML1 n=1 Tax=Dromiciops gliroides TaxID=33562 RepID=UPI001CC61715|nr:probable E3 ubiquitin-protein ligase TRIML1 [Dromiciops gliroides]
MAHLAENLKEELTCSLCMDYFNHPVTLGCGHSFCHHCLLRNWGEVDQPCPCPECKRPFHLRDLECNHSLENLSSMARQVEPYLLKIKEEIMKCDRHETEQNLFCEEDQVLLCEVCFQTPEHSRHTIWPIQKAGEDARDKLQKTLDFCWIQMETVQKMLTEERKKEDSWKEKSHAYRESLTAEYKRFHDLLQQEEEGHLEMLARHEIDYLKSIRESEARLSKQLQSLREVVTDVEKNCQKTNVQILQVVGDTLKRSESLLGHVPDTVSTPRISFHYTLMCEILTYFKVDVTLDIESACPYLIVFEDLKTVVHGGYQQAVTFTPDRFKESIILGSQIFISGTHYWEVDVGDREHMSSCCQPFEKINGIPDRKLKRGETVKHVTNSLLNLKSAYPEPGTWRWGLLEKAPMEGFPTTQNGKCYQLLTDTTPLHIGREALTCSISALGQCTPPQATSRAQSPKDSPNG